MDFSNSQPTGLEKHPAWYNDRVDDKLDIWTENSQPNYQEAWNKRVKDGKRRKLLPTIEEEAQAFENSLPAGEKEVHVSYSKEIYMQ